MQTTTAEPPGGNFISPESEMFFAIKLPETVLYKSHFLSFSK